MRGRARKALARSQRKECGRREVDLRKAPPHRTGSLYFYFFVLPRLGRPFLISSLLPIFIFCFLWKYDIFCCYFQSAEGRGFAVLDDPSWNPRNSCLSRPPVGNTNRNCLNPIKILYFPPIHSDQCVVSAKCSSLFHTFFIYFCLGIGLYSLSILPVILGWSALQRRRLFVVWPGSLTPTNHYWRSPLNHSHTLTYNRRDQRCSPFTFARRLSLSLHTHFTYTLATGLYKFCLHLCRAG